MRASGRIGIAGLALAGGLAAPPLGCVVHVEPPPEAAAGGALASGVAQPPPADFTEVQQRIEVLLDEAQDVDRIDRLQAAHELARRMRSADPHAQRVVLDYLQALVAIEERSRPMEAPRLVVGEADGAPLFAPPVIEEDLGGEEPVAGAAPAEHPATAGGDEDGDAPEAGGEPAEPVDVAARVARAEELVADGRPAEAMTLLESCRERPCWDEVADEWAVARDALVHARRQEAVQRFLSARELADPAARRAAFVAVRDELQDLLDRWPSTRFAEEIRRNIELVDEAIAALGPAEGDAAQEDAPADPPAAASPADPPAAASPADPPAAASPGEPAAGGD